MAAKYTLGPWLIDDAGNETHIVTADRPVARMNGLTLTEDKANAKLIVGAPELLASTVESADAIECAYEDIYQALPDGPVPEWFVRLEAAAKQLRAAIAKATA
ncbi:MAG: hypothetical protein E2576_14470 [Alcaligenaceae bacterium]|nr:hypothetical protein [Alcaligenaceae bacterium SAGV5]MPS50415.1 hypothetical protein [Alcaligenaceae bacterium SAGV3]MPT57924.1 hypothetical protein [Alcaligenaceae bacterium]